MLALLSGWSLVEAQVQGPAADVNDHLWLVYAGTHSFRGPLAFYTEAQVRRANLGATWQQLLLREALMYRFSPQVSAGGGYGSIRTARYGDFPVARPFYEHRVWQQVALQQAVSKVNLEHRYRLEQRWIQNFSSNGSFNWRYQNRFRYQLTGIIPVSKSWYISAGDEVFLGFGGNIGASALDQNRAFASIGYRLSPTNRVEVGYLHQFVKQRNGLIEESNHTIRLQWFSSTPLKQLFH